MDDLAARVAQAPRVTVTGQWQRHIDAAYANSALEGHAGNGRWGTKDGFPVLYLGRPLESVIVEAYRHLVDPLIFDTAEDRARFLATVRPRALVTCNVHVDNLLDLREIDGRSSSGLVLPDLTSDPSDMEAYRRCQEVAQVAHQLRYHGLIAPAATGLGETLVLFTEVLPANQRPTQTEAVVAWTTLPDDPRETPADPALRVVRD